MTQEDLFSLALGIQQPWYIESIVFDKESGRLDINVNFERGSTFEYIDPDTGERGQYKAYDTSKKSWRHMNFFQYRCYLNAWIPRVNTGNKIRQVKAPWEGIATGFTLLFEAFILELSKVMPVHQIASLIGVYDNKIWTMLKEYVEKCRESLDYSEVHQIGVDETAARRGHDYVTLFVDLEKKQTMFVAEGKGSQTIESFVADLEAHNGVSEQVEQVTCDMSPAFIKGVEENLVNAKITFDKFHVIKIVNEAVDKVRKEEQKTNPILKQSRFIFLKNRKNLTTKQAEQLVEISMSKANLKTYKAMQIRESLQQIYNTGNNKTAFAEFLKKWYFWATHCRIEPIIKVAKTIKNHWQGILNYSESRINNGLLEGLNSIFQAAKAKARGYKNFHTISTIIYLLTSKLDFSVKNDFCRTHSFL